MLFMCCTLIKALNKLKNASLINKEVVYLNFDLKYFEVLRVLYREGFIQGYKDDKKKLPNHRILKVFPK